MLLLDTKTQMGSWYHARTTVIDSQKTMTCEIIVTLMFCPMCNRAHFQLCQRCIYCTWCKRHCCKLTSEGLRKYMVHS